MLRSNYHWLMPACLLLAGCLDANTEQEQIRVVLSPLYYSEVYQPSGTRALQGTQACFNFQLKHVEGQDLSPPAAVTCFDATIAGVPVHEGDCMVLEELGPLQIDFTPRADCPFPELADSLVADRFLLEVVSGEGLRAGFEWYMEHAGLRELTSAEPVPADLIPAADEPLRLVPGVEVGFPINVVDAAGERVAWDLSQGIASESRDGGPGRELRRTEPESSIWLVSIGAGEHSTMILEIGDELFPLAEVVATPAEEAASIQVVAGYGDDAPYGARAIVRDDEGHVILGAPVEWSLVEGELALQPFDVTPLPPEYINIADECVPPPTAAEPRRAVLRAQFGALSDEIELEWTAMPPDTPSDEPFEPSKTCVRGTNTPDEPAEPAEDDRGDSGCNCASTPGTGQGSWAWLLLLALGRRRRGWAGQR